jgi:hypothetical protein
MRALLDAGELALQRARHQGVAQRNLQTFRADRLDHEIGCARTHHRDHIVDAAVGGLHDDGQRDAGLAQPRQHAETVEIRHDQIEHDRVDRGPLRSGEQRHRGVAACGHECIIAEATDHILEQPPLHRIVVDDQNSLTHGGTSDDRGLCRNGALSPITLKAVLSQPRVAGMVPRSIPSPRAGAHLLPQTGGDRDEGQGKRGRGTRRQFHPAALHRELIAPSSRPICGRSALRDSAMVSLMARLPLPLIGGCLSHY